MGNRVIKGKEFLADLRRGMTDADLMDKYCLSQHELGRLFDQALEKGKISNDEIECRYTEKKPNQPDDEGIVAGRESLEEVSKPQDSWTKEVDHGNWRATVDKDKITNKSLTKARNSFIAGFLILIGIGIVFKLFFLLMIRLDSPLEGITEFAALATLFAKIYFIYCVFTLSRFLQQPIWLTIVYCILSPFALLYLIPLFGLLISVKMKRRGLLRPTGN